MKSIRISLNIPTLVVALALIGVLAYQASARRTVMINPTVVVTVNRSLVLQGLNERAEAQAELRQMEARFKEKSDRLKLELETL
ncbi:MAG: hypothetical protein O7G85_07720, partial [Planctomycetota bacterium]|nr:hypothetical protein [Planctomycetota bacterium]